MARSTLLLKRPGFSQRWLQLPRLQLPPSLRSIGAPLLVAIVYYLAAQAAFAVGTLSDRIFAPFWPPNIVLFCALLLVPKRLWWLYVAASFPPHVIAEIGVGMPFAQYMVAFATNCMVAMLSALGVRRFVKDSAWFGTLRDAAIYIVVTAGVSPAISAFGGAFVQILGGGPVENYWLYWGNWYIANAIGSVTLGPVLLIWFGSRPRPTAFKSRRTVEAIILGLSLIAACAIVFQLSAERISTGFLPAVIYSPFPLILWAAIRFGQWGATGSILVVTVVAISENLHDRSVFIGANPETSVLALQLFLLGIAIPVFLLGVAIDELRRSGEATRRLAGAVLRAQDEERRRIARELHDSTGQHLVVAGLMASRVESMAPPSCGPVITELQDVLEKAMMEVRTVSYLLHPPLLDAGGLGIALGAYIEGFSKRTGISVDLDLSPDFGRLPSNVELVLFRVIQEALTNVWRHSGSRTARIQLMRQVSRARPQVILSIEDAGKGIPDNVRQSTLSSSDSRRQPVPSGVGLAGMRERLYQIGGRLYIDSITGKTIIKAIAPLTD